MWPFPRTRPIHFINAQVVGLEGVLASSLRIAGGRITGIDGPSQQNDIQVNLDGAYIFPGLINAHDHLEHNHYGRVKFQEKYANATAWMQDMNPRLNSDLRLKEGRSKPLPDRLFIGGLKNLLSGVTTVAHHNPFYRQLRGGFPIHVVREYGWAHSLYLQGGKAGANGEGAGTVREEYQSTPPDVPFFLHLAEGTDSSARKEFQILEELGCLGPNTILVHGVALGSEDWKRIGQTGAGVIWCPASNFYLLGETIPVRQVIDSGGLAHIALGTDSRLTGSRDLLEEMRFARRAGGVSPKEIFAMVTRNPARLLHLSFAGNLGVGWPADLVIIPPLNNDPLETICVASRRDIWLVLVEGRPQYGALGAGIVFEGCRVKTYLVDVDEELKLLGEPWAGRLKQCALAETGVVWPTK